MQGCSCCRFTRQNKEISLKLLAALLRGFFCAPILRRISVGGLLFLSPTLKKCQNSAWLLPLRGFLPQSKNLSSWVEWKCKDDLQRNWAKRTEPIKQSENKWKWKRSSGRWQNLYLQLTVFIRVSLNTSAVTDGLWSRLRAWERNS